MQVLVFQVLEPRVIHSRQFFDGDLVGDIQNFWIYLL